MTQSLTQQLLPCPFCGDMPTLIEHPPHTHRYATFMPDHPGSWSIDCSCLAGMIKSDREEVIAAWNRRAAIAAAPLTQQLLDALREIMPSRLCGESWNLPDDDTVSIVVTFGKVARARAAITAAEGALAAERENTPGTFNEGIEAAARELREALELTLAALKGHDPEWEYMRKARTALANTRSLTRAPQEDVERQGGAE